MIYDRYGNRIKSYEADGYNYSGAVASYFPNGFGLYNMSGNVAEWVQDVYLPGFSFLRDSNFDGNEVSAEIEPVDSATFMKKYMAQLDGRHNDGSPLEDENEDDITYNITPRAELAWREYKFGLTHTKPSRVTKGGGWANPLSYLQIGSRVRAPETTQNSWTGFRICITQVASPTTPHPVMQYIDKQSTKKK
jgi:formylglycine-generating enzyme required for sulfatase activity